MSTKENNICIIDFSDKKSDQESKSEFFLSWGKWKGCIKWLVGNGSAVRLYKVSTQAKFERALEGCTDLSKKIAKLDELNKLAYEDLILSIITNFSVGKVAFSLFDMQKAQKSQGKLQSSLEQISD